MTTQTMLWPLLRIEARKLAGRALLWVILALLAFLVIALNVALIAALAQSNLEGVPPTVLASLRASLQWPQSVLMALTFANGGELGGLFVAVLVGALVAQEYTWHTVHLWLSRGVKREAYLLAKFGVIVAALLLLVLVALLAGSVTTGIYTWQATGRLPWHAVPWGHVVAGIFETTLTLLPYAALTFAVAVLSRSSMVAVGVGLGYSLLVENLAAEVLMLVSPTVARVVRFLPGLLSKSVMRAVSPSETALMMSPTQTTAPPPLLSPGWAAVLLLGYTALGLGVAWWAFRKQDISA